MACEIASAGFVVCVVPVTGTPMKLANAIRRFVDQPRAEHVGEQMVVSVPGSTIVERHDEQVGSLQLLESCLAAAAAGHRVAERPFETREDGRLQQKLADLVALAFEDLLDEVVDDEAVVAGEACR